MRLVREIDFEGWNGFSKGRYLLWGLRSSGYPRIEFTHFYQGNADYFGYQNSILRQFRSSIYTFIVDRIGYEGLPLLVVRDGRSVPAFVAINVEIVALQDHKTSRTKHFAGNVYVHGGLGMIWEEMRSGYKRGEKRLQERRERVIRDERSG